MKEHKRILKNKEEELLMRRSIEQDAWTLAQERPVKNWESMWVADLTKVIRIGPEVRIEDGFYDSIGVEDNIYPKSMEKIFLD